MIRLEDSSGTGDSIDDQGHADYRRQGRRVQVRKAPRGSFTGAARQVFLDHLAGCCNVTASAMAAGVGVSTVYDARRREPDFAEQWGFR
jgi:hypothetical protein